MKTKIYTSFFIPFLLFTFLNNTQLAAQSWQWGRVGSNLKSYQTLYRNSKMATDLNGNLYTISIDSNINVPGYFRQGYTKGGEAICIISYDCEGNHRWSKMIQSGLDFEIKTDKVGGVYITGVIFAKEKPVKIDEDTTIGITEKMHFMVKYDTSGNYKWFQMFEPDTLNPAHKAYDYTGINFCVSPQGDARIYTVLMSGVFCNGQYTVRDSLRTCHVLAYNSTGQFLGGTKLGYNSDVIEWDYKRDKFYQFGYTYDTLTYGNSVKANSFVLCKMDNRGKLEWVKSGSLTKILDKQIDSKGNIYFSCIVPSDSTFDGHVFKNDSSKGDISAILKYSPDGQLLWLCSSKEGIGEDFFFAVNNNSIAAFGPLSKPPLFIRWADGYEVGRSFKPSTYSIYSDTTNLGNYLVLIDAFTGKITKVDSILGAQLRPTGVCGNNKGGFFLKGNFWYRNKKLIMPFVDTLISNPPTSTVSSYLRPFLLKYGTPDCVPMIIDRDLSALIYPNPASAYFTIQNAALESNLKIYNTIGQKVWSTTIKDLNQKINIEHLPSGIYLIEFSDLNNQKRFTKLIKKE